MAWRPRHARKLPHAVCVLVLLRAPAPVVELVLVTARGAASAALELLAGLLQTRALAEG